MRRFRSGSGWHAVGLRRPEIIWTETMGRARRDRGAEQVGLAIHRGEQDRTPAGSRERRGRRGRGEGDQHWSAVDIFAMIIAAFRVILPPMIAILAAATAAYGLFMLLFG